MNVLFAYYKQSGLSTDGILSLVPNLSREPVSFDAELRELAKFYETAAGKKFLEIMPEITRQSLMIGNRIGQEVALELQQEMTNELRNRGHKL